MQTIPFPDPGRPDTRSPLRFLLWTALRWRTQLLGLVFGMLWMLAIALVPAAVGRGIDEGIVAGDPAALARWSLALLGLGAVAAASGAARHYLAVHNWLYASYRSAQITARGIEEAGPALTRTIPSGEVIAVFANDVMRIGGLFDVAGRFTGALVATSWSARSCSRPRRRSAGSSCSAARSCSPCCPSSSARCSAARRNSASRRPPHHPRRGHGCRPARPARDRWRADLPEPLRGPVATGPRRRRARGRGPGGARLRTGPAARRLRRPRHLGGREVRGGRPDQRGPARGLLRVCRVPDHAAAHRDRVRRPAHPGEHRRAQGAADPRRPAGPVPGKPGRVPLPDPSGDLRDPVSGATVRAGRLTALVSARPEDTAAIADRLGRFGPGPHDATWGGLPLSEPRAARDPRARRRERGGPAAVHRHPARPAAGRSVRRLGRPGPRGAARRERARRPRRPARGPRRLVEERGVHRGSASAWR